MSKTIKNKRTKPLLMKMSKKKHAEFLRNWKKSLAFHEKFNICDGC